MPVYNFHLRIKGKLPEHIPPVHSSPLWRVWANMLTRCYNPNSTRYYNWGGRGIRVCREWRRNFRAFDAWGKANGYAPGLQLNRIDNNKSYNPDNCNWVTSSQNGRNRRGNVLITAWGETKTRVDWVEDSRCVIGYFALRDRIARGISPEEAMSNRRNAAEKRLPEW